MAGHFVACWIRDLLLGASGLPTPRGHERRRGGQGRSACSSQAEGPQQESNKSGGHGTAHHKSIVSDVPQEGVKVAMDGISTWHDPGQAATAAEVSAARAGQSQELLCLARPLLGVPSACKFPTQAQTRPVGHIHICFDLRN